MGEIKEYYGRIGDKDDRFGIDLLIHERFFAPLRMTTDCDSSLCKE